MPDTPSPDAPAPASRTNKTALRWLGVGLAVAVVGTLAVVLPLVLSGGDPGTSGGADAERPPVAAGRLHAESLYGEKFTVTATSGETVVLNRTAAANHTGPCAEAAETPETAGVLAACMERLEAAYETSDGVHRVDQQILVMKDDTAAADVLSRKDLGALRLKAMPEGSVNSSTATRWDRENNLVIVTTAGTVNWREAAYDTLSPAITEPVRDHVLGLIRTEMGWKSE